MLHVVDPGVRHIGVYELNVKFGFFRPLGVMGLGLSRVSLIGFLLIVGWGLGLGRRLLCEHDAVFLILLVL